MKKKKTILCYNCGGRQEKTTDHDIDWHLNRHFSKKIPKDIPIYCCKTCDESSYTYDEAIEIDRRILEEYCVENFFDINE